MTRIVRSIVLFARSIIKILQDIYTNYIIHIRHTHTHTHTHTHNYIVPSSSTTSVPLFSIVVVAGTCATTTLELSLFSAFCAFKECFNIYFATNSCGSSGLTFTSSFIASLKVGTTVSSKYCLTGTRFSRTNCFCCA